MHPASSHNIAYVTDIEGNFEYLMRFVEMTKALTFVGLDQEDGSAELVLEDGWHFIFGGDAVDKGGSCGGSIRVVRTLVRLKKEYPDRVTLILGNRDINKMRLTSELTPFEIADVASVPGAEWVPESKRISPLQHVHRVTAARASLALDDVTPEMVASANTVSERLRWMLTETMGADGEFERRREELTKLAGGVRASEEATTNSFIESVLPGGFMHELLSLGQLGALHNETIFVHGGLIGSQMEGGDCFGYVPGLPERLLDDVHEWLARLNAWKDQQLAEWMAHPTWTFDAGAASAAIRGAKPASSESTASAAGGARGWRGGQDLVWYATSGAVPSVILGRHLDDSGMPAPTPPQLMAALNQCGVRRIIVGHTPHGDCPTVIKSGGPNVQSPGFEVIMADTSYSDMRQGDNRGVAVSEVILRSDGRVHVHGQLGDGRAINYELSRGVGPRSELVGQLEPWRSVVADANGVRERYFVKAVLTSGDLLLSHVHGFVVKYATISAQAASELFYTGSFYTGSYATGSYAETQPANPKVYRLRLAQVLQRPWQSIAALRRGQFSGATFQTARRKLLACRTMYTPSCDEGHSPHQTHACLPVGRMTLIAEIFQNADGDHSGELSLDELRVAMERDSSFMKLLSGTGIVTADAEDLLLAIDTSGDGKIRLDEFQQFCADGVDANELRLSAIATNQPRSGPPSVPVHVTNAVAGKVQRSLDKGMRLVSTIREGWQEKSESLPRNSQSLNA